MARTLFAVALLATAICGVKGAPRPPEAAAIAGSDAGISSGAVAPDATGIDPAQDPLALDAGCADGGAK